MSNHTIIESSYDSARPFAVLAPVGCINRVKGRYATKAQAARRVRDLDADC